MHCPLVANRKMPWFIETQFEGYDRFSLAKWASISVLAFFNQSFLILKLIWQSFTIWWFLLLVPGLSVTTGPRTKIRPNTVVERSLKTRHWQFYLLPNQLYWKDENKAKEAGNDILNKVHTDFKVEMFTLFLTVSSCVLLLGPLSRHLIILCTKFISCPSWEEGKTIFWLKIFAQIQKLFQPKNVSFNDCCLSLRKNFGNQFNSHFLAAATTTYLHLSNACSGQYYKHWNQCNVCL